tara:strand:+ start:1016 stop:1762 length:747 start_codon:yes stop_codon:yes gene_type:complete
MRVKYQSNTMRIKKTPAPIYLIKNKYIDNITMPKKCPPGVICIENITFIFFGLLILTTIAVLYMNFNNGKMMLAKNQNGSTLYKNENKFNDYTNHSPNRCHYHNHNHNQNHNSNNDILLNPYSAPLRDDRLINNDNYNGSRMPINQPTQSHDTTYRQIGILTRVQGGETMLPLMGRPLFSNRDKWNFYTMNDKNNMIKLPITFKNKSCTNDQGCDNVYNGDKVYVEGYNDIFKVTVYDNNVMQYIPYL